MGVLVSPESKGYGDEEQEFQGRETGTCLGGMLQIHISEPSPHLLNQNSWRERIQKSLQCPK